MRALKLTILSAGLLLAASFDSSVWRYVDRVLVLDPGSLNAVAFDRGIYSRMRTDLADLRIIRGGAEVPYTIETLSGSVEQAECNAEVLNKSVAPGEGLRLTLDAAGCGSTQKHSRIRISTELVNFRQKVRIQTGDDDKFWVTAREDGYIFDFTQGDRKFSALTVDYPVSTARYVRATIFGWKSVGAVTGAWSAYRVEQAPERIIIDSITPERSVDAGAKASILKLDLGQTGLPHDRIRLDVEKFDFHRIAELEASEDDKTWRPVTRGTIFQVSGEESLALTYPVRHDRYMRLRIFDGDSPPVPVVRIYVERMKQLIQFLLPKGGDVLFYYGNPNARLPSYDLAAILSHRKPMALATPAIEPWKVNPDYRLPAMPKKPWTDRHPVFLYLFLGVSIAGMGVVTVLFLMKVRES